MKIAYWIVTILMCALFLFSAQMYFRNPDMIQGYFEAKGFAPWIVIPLAVAKILGIVAVLTDLSKILREWAYAGFFYDVVLASSMHYITGDGLSWMSVGGIGLVLLSRFLLQYRYVDTVKNKEKF